MKHTAKSISTSPNPQILEMRILANHASDERFAFLRGRWPDAWVSVKERLRRVRINDPERKKKEEKAVGALLGGYDSSAEDSEEDEENEDEEAVSGTPLPPDEEGLPPPPPSPPSLAPICPGDEAVAAIADTTVDTQDITPQVQPIEVADTGEEEKKRLRRLKAEEWKRKRAEEKACM